MSRTTSSTTNDSGAQPSERRDAISPSYASLLGINGPVPKWLPISFLAISSAALVVPIVMLRRYKFGLKTAASGDALHPSPPRRRQGTVATTGSRVLGSGVVPPPRVRSRIDMSPVPSSSSPKSLSNHELQASTRSIPSSPTARPFLQATTADDAFNAPLYTLKAFTIATAIVAAGASASVLGIMAYLGVHDTSEFATRMRLWIISTLPVLSERIHRRPEAKDHEALTPLYSTSNVPDDAFLASSLAVTGMQGPPSDTTSTLNLAESQARLAAAYDRGGLREWVEVAMKVLEAEAEMERARKAATVAGAAANMPSEVKA
ncbi:hypothetical protein ID866_3228 [Astraeus odoratus]|nr:hypothetical protein ID866_3228 [Astraeus odoratus]